MCPINRLATPTTNNTGITIIAAPLLDA
jgi:hypothetical protein